MKDEKKKIIVTHVNVRLSISVLLLKLILIEVFAGGLLILWHIGLAFYVTNISLLHTVIVIGLPALIFLVFVKTFITIFIILQWLNEYYEISSDMIEYRRGIFFRRVEHFPTNDIKFIDVEQEVLGRIFNFGTITLLNVRRMQFAQMYMIHNPMRYAQVIEDIVPGLVEKKRLVRRHFHDNNENSKDTDID